MLQSHPAVLKRHLIPPLTMCLHRGGEHLPDSEEMETLPFHELAVRLCFKFDDGQNRPDVDEEVEGASQVDDGLLDLMGRQLHYANLVYEGQQDPSILDMLKDDGEVHCGLKRPDGAGAICTTRGQVKLRSPKVAWALSIVVAVHEVFAVLGPINLSSLHAISIQMR